MKRNVIKLIFWTIILLLCTTCTRTTKVEVDGYWKRLLHFDATYNYKANGISDGDRFYSIGKGGLAIHEDLERHPTVGDSNYNTFGIHYKPVMTENMTAGFTNYSYNGVIVITNTIPVRSFSFRTAHINEAFQNYMFLVTGYNSIFGAFNENHTRFVTVITGPNPPLYSTGANSYLVYVDFFDDGNQFSITNTGYWETDRSTSMGHFYQNNFYYYSNVSQTATLFKFSNENCLSIMPYPFSINSGIKAFFTYQDYLFIQLNNGLVAYSSDVENWYEVARVTPSLIDWRGIDDYLFIYLMDRVYCIGDVFGSIVTLYGLPVENMEGATITSVSKFKDDLVITTSNGIYYKNFDQVMQDKEYISSVNRGNIFNIGE